jgi:xanthine dehydrogenase accessory factor
MSDLTSIVRLLQSPERPTGVLATLVSVEGSSYRREGARLFLADSGFLSGSISGGCLEEDIRARAKAVATSGRAELVTYDTTSENDLVWGVGLGCHGIVKVLLEPIREMPAWASAVARNLESRTQTGLGVVWSHPDPGRLGTMLAVAIASTGGESRVFRETVPPPPALFVFGAGDDARPVVRLAAGLGWHVVVADPRAALATRDRFPEAASIVTGPAESLVSRADPEPGAYAIAMTHHYVHDKPLLRDLLARPLAYLGLLGPRKRAERILGDLGLEGEISRIHAPVGLDLGADGPEEVALSILSEMQMVLGRRDGRPLRERTGPIHGKGT